MIRQKFLIAVLIGVACSAPVATSAAADDFRIQVDENAATLTAGHYAAASQAIDRTITAMVERLGGGEAEERLFATALVHKALACAGVGNIDDALWYWSVAQAISPAAGKMDLAPFKAPGEFLALHPPTRSEGTGFADAIHVVKEVMPSFPRGASRFGIAGDLVVQIVVDRAGKPTLPRIIRPLPAPTLSFVALEALRQWRFQPATRNGEAVPAVFNLTVHYKL